MRGWWLACSVALMGCGPSVLQTQDEVDARLSRGANADACGGLQAVSEDVRTYTAGRLVEHASDPKVGECLCNAAYDKEKGTFDKAIAGTFRDSRQPVLASCLSQALEDARVANKVDVADALGATLTRKGYTELEGLLGADNEAPVRAAAVAWLGRSDAHLAAAIDTLGTDPEPSVRAAAAAGMKPSTKDEADKALREAIKNDPSAQVRQSAVIAASDPLARTTARVLCKTMMEDEDAGVRKAAVLAFTGTSEKADIKCLQERLLSNEEDGGVRGAILDVLEKAPTADAREVLCDAIGPFMRMYVREPYTKVDGAHIVTAQNNRDWDNTYSCLQKALSQGGLSCYARNHLANWYNDVGGSMSAPWCPGLPRN